MSGHPVTPEPPDFGCLVIPLHRSLLISGVWSSRYTGACSQVNEWGPTDIFVPDKARLKLVRLRLQQHGFSFSTLVPDVGG